MLLSGIFLVCTSLTFAFQVAAPATTILQLSAPPAAPAESAPHNTVDHEAPDLEPLQSDGQMADLTQSEDAETISAEDTPPRPATQSPGHGPEDMHLVAPEAWDPYVDAARTALATVRTARGRFLQVNDDGSYIEGNFALRRPGRMRFEYDAPSPILIVADGTTVAITDTDLETVDRVPLSSTPLNVLLDDDIDFEAEVETLQILKWPDQVAITVQSLSGDVEGMLTLLFDSDAKTLIGWRSIDTEGLTTQITLSEVETGIRLNPRLFRLDEPADEDDER